MWVVFGFLVSLTALCIILAWASHSLTTENVGDPNYEKWLRYYGSAAGLTGAGAAFLVSSLLVLLVILL